ncbi:cation-transporting P-type ATPase [Klebsiella michiganensis]|nr:cation-transporting P-type ATPase [Klebsiella michiganensis]
MLAQKKSHVDGLSAAEAAERLKTFGPNALPEKKGKPAWLRFLAHFNDVLIFVLLYRRRAHRGHGPLGRYARHPGRHGDQRPDRTISRRATPKNRCRASAICSPATRACSAAASMKPSRPATWCRAIS